MSRLLSALLLLCCATLCAKAPDNPVAEGHDAYQQGNYSEAVRLYRQAAVDDRWPELQAEAQDSLGRMFSRGEGVTQDGAEAIAWFEKSAALGNIEAPTDIGDVYFFAHAVPRDLVKAMQWYKKGADRGSLHGMDQLAWCYLNGLGVTENVDAARDLYLKTAQRNSPTGAYQYGWILAHVEPIDYCEAMTWYLKAAAQNHATAKNNIGYLYENGLGVDKDYPTAAQWYKQAASAGDRRGQYHLGLLYEQGLGVKKSLKKASTLMRASASAGNGDAIEWLAVRNISDSP